jgi:hypothetical protein
LVAASVPVVIIPSLFLVLPFRVVAITVGRVEDMLVTAAETAETAVLYLRFSTILLGLLGPLAVAVAVRVGIPRQEATGGPAPRPTTGKMDTPVQAAALV